MMKDDQYFLDKLVAEKEGIENQLKGIAVRNPDRPGFWQAISSEDDSDMSLNGDSAEMLETITEREQLVRSLATRLEEIRMAEERIKEGKGGSCVVCSQPIEEERREADPASVTCRAHREQEDRLNF